MFVSERTGSIPHHVTVVRVETPDEEPTLPTPGVKASFPHPGLSLHYSVADLHPRPSKRHPHLPSLPVPPSEPESVEMVKRVVPHSVGRARVSRGPGGAVWSVLVWTTVCQEFETFTVEGGCLCPGRSGRWHGG